jgi:transcriptional regulator with XRE-family HTH domain
MNHRFKEYTDAEIVQALGVRFKEYRLSRRLTQKDVSEQTGISILTIRKFENGQAYNIQMSNFIALMRLLDRLDDIDNLLPEIPVSAYEVEKIMKNRPRRIRHAK